MVNALIKSVLTQDTAPVVLCDLQHRIVYMNPAAERNYAKYGGDALVGRSLMECHNLKSQAMIQQVVNWFAADRNNNRLFTFHNDKQNKDVYMVALRAEDGTLIGYYEKHEYRNPETAAAYDFSRSL